MKIRFAQCLPLLALPLMVACGGGSSTGGSAGTPGTSTAPGTLQYPTAPPLGQVALTADQFKANLTASATGASLYALASTVAGATSLPPAASAALPCGVEVHKLEFFTTGAAGETARSSGALMLPLGSSPLCTGKRPIVLYAHGTVFDKTYDISALQLPTNPGNSESALVAALYASNGYIVVAPNYAGYDDSTLSYHPYLVAAQQAGEMTDALTAARSALPLIGGVVQDSGALLVSGYSQGGHVAMATVRHLEALGKTVAASTPMSGPYALEAQLDAIFAGNVNIGATLFLPLATAGYQKAYGNLYHSTTDIYTSQFANHIDTLLPSTLTKTQLFTQGLVPQSALFDSAPPAPYNALFPPITANQFGFGTTFLITDLARATYLGDPGFPDPAIAHTGILPSATTASTIRADAKLNDLRLPEGSSASPFWRPHSAMLMCAGGGDPVVFALNTAIMSAYFGAAAAQSVPGATPLQLNVDQSSASVATFASTTGLDTQFAQLEGAFAQTNAADATANGAQQALIDYHGNVAPFCSAASVLFFKSIAP